jgi:ABC-type uncharacterized transport system auxiliary subunit
MRCLAPIFTLAAILCGCGSNPAWKSQDFAFSLPADPAVASVGTNVIALQRVIVSPLFQGRPFIYRTGENSYEQDPYAGFLVSPDRAIAEPIRAGLRSFGRVLEPGSALSPDLVAEVDINQLYGDFRASSQPVGTLQLHFLLYEQTSDGPGRVVLDRICARSTPLASKTPGALIAAWDADLHEIMEQIHSDYAKANSNDSGR